MTTAQQHLEGKTKILTPTERPGEFRVAFKDSATAFNGKKFAIIPGKGELNARISAILFGLLNEFGVATCFVSVGASASELIYRQLKMIPLEVVIRNYAYGSICKRFQFEEGRCFNQPLLEFFLKDDAAGDPQITDELIQELGILPGSVCLQKLKEQALRVNEIFLAYFNRLGIRCCDFKLEFGVDAHGALCLGDELSPDNFRLRDAQTAEILDKDVFRLELADLAETYRKLLGRMEAAGFGPLELKGMHRYQADIKVQSRKNILNPESKAILEALHTMGYSEVTALQAGKRFSVTLAVRSMGEAEDKVKAMTETLLANPVIEDFSWTLTCLPGEGG